MPLPSTPNPLKTEPFWNLHQVLELSVLREHTESLTQASTKIPIPVKEKMEEICRKQGTTLAAFLRTCCERFCHEYYQGPEIDLR